MNNSTGVTTRCPPVTTPVYTLYPLLPRNNGSLMGQTPVYLLFPWGLRSLPCRQLPSSLYRAEFSCSMPCSPSHDHVSISKSSSFIDVSTFISSNNTTRGFCPKRCGKVGGKGETRDLKGRAGKRALVPLANRYCERFSPSLFTTNSW